MLPSRLTVPEIARELGISTNTLKTHLKGLYRKLGVTSRGEAVVVARELGVVHDPKPAPPSMNPRRTMIVLHVRPRYRTQRRTRATNSRR